MDLKPGMKLHGFTVKRVRPVPGASAQLVEMLYEKTRTELVWYKTEESNKLFNVIFKTLPQDSTGVFHILEHSLLCGSAKYPVKEPFVELMKSTMSTFINAITFPDKTMYPVGSRNEQDFLNLTQVYLDAAFAPRALVDERIFRQEGWHHEIGEDGLTYNGVVFNEMKGAMSSVDEVVYEEMMAMLFPDTSYGFNYGGDPKVIPQLTYAHFCQSYREHYHPSNARIYLDGSVPLEKTLCLIDGYLSRFDLSGRRQEKYQTPRACEKTVRFEIGAGENPADRHQLVLGRILGTWQEKDRILAAKVLCQVLCGANTSPLKRAVLDAGLAQDVTMEIMDGLAQPMFYLRANNMKKENAPRIRQIIRQTAEQLVETGLDAQQLTAAINRLAFRSRDVEDPQALYRCLFALNAWLYEGDPMTYLTCEESVEHLRAMIPAEGFEKLLRELLLEEEGLCVLNAEPDPDHGKKGREEEQQRLAREYDAMTEEELRALAEKNEILHNWQQTPDSPGELAALPVLSLDQVSPQPQVLLPREAKLEDITILCHDTETNGIVHLNIYFDLTDRSIRELSAIRFLWGLPGKLPTANYTAAELDNEIKTWLGKLSFSLEVFGNEADKDRCRPCLAARCSVLKENLPRAKELLTEILLRTRLEDTDAAGEILRQNISDALPMIIGIGHVFAANCAMAHFSARNAAAEAAEGYSWVKWMKTAEADFDNRREELRTMFSSLLEQSVCRRRMTLSVAGAEPEELADFLAAFPEGTAAPAAMGCATELPRKLGIQIPAQVSYACTGYRLDRCGESYRGTAQLAANILSLSCLWNSIRVQGGAYGAGMDCDRTGSIYCYSYRDPSPARSLGLYRELSGFLRDFPNSGESLTKYIISTIASTEPLMKPNRTVAEADRLWFCGIDREALLRERKQLLEADFASLTDWCPMLEAMAGDAAVCVLGHEAALRDCAGEGLTVYSL